MVNWKTNVNLRQRLEVLSVPSRGGMQRFCWTLHSEIPIWCGNVIQTQANHSRQAPGGSWNSFHMDLEEGEGLKLAIAVSHQVAPTRCCWGRPYTSTPTGIGPQRRYGFQLRMVGDEQGVPICEEQKLADVCVSNSMKSFIWFIGCRLNNQHYFCFRWTTLCVRVWLLVWATLSGCISVPPPPQPPPDI